MYRFKLTVYDKMLTNSEMWFCDEWGNRMLIDQCMFLDC
jgi:hypothetical protein